MQPTRTRSLIFLYLLFSARLPGRATYADQRASQRSTRRHATKKNIWKRNLVSSAIMQPTRTRSLILLYLLFSARLPGRATCADQRASQRSARRRAHGARAATRRRPHSKRR